MPLTTVNDFVSTTKTPLPVLAVDIPAHMLAQLGLTSDWIREDEAWKAMLHVMVGQERSYVESLRTTVREYAAKRSGRVGGWLWLYSLREGKVSCQHTVLASSTFF